MCCRAWFLAVGLLIAVGFSACSSKTEALPPAPGETGAELTEADKKKLDDLKARFGQMREKAMAASAEKEAGASDAVAQQTPAADAAQAPAEGAADATADAPAAEQPTGPRPSILLGAFLQPLNAMMQNSLQAAMSAASQAVPAAGETPAAAAPAAEEPAAETPATEPPQN